MAKFMHTIDYDQMVNLDHVVKIKCYRDGHGRDVASLYDREGEVLGTVSGKALDRLVVGVVVPAPPGYQLVTFLPDYAPDEAATTIQEPIIAFAFDEGGRPTPLTLNGNPVSDQNAWGIVRPDGVVVVPDDSEFETVEKFLNEQIRILEDERARRQSKLATAKGVAK